MKFEVGAKIYARDASPELAEWCRENLVLDNPEYEKKQRMGFWTGNVPKQICLYERQGNDLCIPFGCISSLLQEFPGTKAYSLMGEGYHVKYYPDFDLYPYQKEAVRSALKKMNGVIVMPCGAGKTQTALAIIATLGLRALWLTHTQDLLNQSLNRAKSVFNNASSIYGTITSGKVNIGSGITFATVQTMSKLDLTQYKDTWNIIIVDECHKAIGAPTKVMQFYKVLSNLSCRYKFGLTATPKRADGLERSMFALLGDVIHEVSRDEVSSTTCPVNVEFVRTGYMPDMNLALAGDGTINYAGLVKDLTGNSERLYNVAVKINQVAEQGATLVLANRVEYLQRLEGILTKAGRTCICLSAMGQSKAAKAARKEALRKLDAGEIDCVLSTYQLAAEGLDCPNLRYVVFATPEKNERVVEQASGRVARKAEGKDHGTVIDFLDDFGLYNGWSKKRKGYYRRLGYDILGDA